MAPTQDSGLILLLGELKRGQDDMREAFDRQARETREWREEIKAEVDELRRWQDRARFVMYTIGPLLLIVIGVYARKLILS